MKHAYLILAHKTPGQLSDLIRAIGNDDCYILIHIDRKVDLRDFTDQIAENDRIFYCHDRIEVNWGGFSQIRATLKLIDLLIQSGMPVTYVHLLSGQDYPVQTNEEISHFFKQGKDKNYIDAFILPCSGWGVNDGLDQYLLKWHIDEKGNVMCKQEHEKNLLERRVFPKGMQPYGGSQWWSLHIDCVKYLHQTCVRGNVLYDYYEYAYIPDEMFFQTVIMNSSWKETVVCNNYRFIDWSNGKGHPVTLGKKHYFKLVESNCIFARKFDPEFDPDILMYLKTYRDRRSINPHTHTKL
jgi:hypothetical protein